MKNTRARRAWAQRMKRGVRYFNDLSWFEGLTNRTISLADIFYDRRLKDFAHRSTLERLKR